MNALLYNLVALLFICLPAAFLFKLVGKDQNFLKKIYREKKLGIAIAAVTMAWAASLGVKLFAGDFPAIADKIPIIAPIVIIAVFFYMDFILPRALGALYLMLIIAIFDTNFDEGVAFRGLSSIIWYAWAVIAMYLVGQPWRLRDLMLKVADKKLSAKKVALPVIISVVLAILPVVIHYV